ncbi:helix-turn-helix domain-containing protein [Roseicella sp. DB1501]|uniref:helix-turn-helix domain-containing protein n=1 Tax=Roseicella sp. DB1501 TaxID=2730925 RepID=UPI001491D6C8|nr:helix-turn-helix transcriptional regulator [Roseicella sp. DB1501]NOG73583.1 helix-turn-helix transcriptional regulator [Roseicella sp. DB1501]
MHEEEETLPLSPSDMPLEQFLRQKINEDQLYNFARRLLNWQHVQAAKQKESARKGARTNIGAIETFIAEFYSPTVDFLRHCCAVTRIPSWYFEPIAEIDKSELSQDIVERWPMGVIGKVRRAVQDFLNACWAFHINGPLAEKEFSDVRSALERQVATELAGWQDAKATSTHRSAAPEEDARTLGANLYRLRVGSGLTQTELSALSGVTQSHISAIERAAFEPRVKTIMALARALKVQPGELLPPLDEK